MWRDDRSDNCGGSVIPPARGCVHVSEFLCILIHSNCSTGVCCWSSVAAVSQRLPCRSYQFSIIAKFHYTGPTGPGSPTVHGLCLVASGLDRVVEFSYNSVAILSFPPTHTRCPWLGDSESREGSLGTAFIVTSSAQHRRWHTGTNHDIIIMSLQKANSKIIFGDSDSFYPIPDPQFLQKSPLDHPPPSYTPGSTYGLG